MSSKINGKPHPFRAPDASFATGFSYPFRLHPSPGAPVPAPPAASPEVPVATRPVTNGSKQ